MKETLTLKCYFQHKVDWLWVYLKGARSRFCTRDVFHLLFAVPIQKLFTSNDFTAKIRPIQLVVIGESLQHFKIIDYNENLFDTLIVKKTPDQTR